MIFHFCSALILAGAENSSLSKYAAFASAAEALKQLIPGAEKRFPDAMLFKIDPVNDGFELRVLPDFSRGRQRRKLFQTKVVKNDLMAGLAKRVCRRCRDGVIEAPGFGWARMMEIFINSRLLITAGSATLFFHGHTIDAPAVTGGSKAAVARGAF
jgi:hypothetical protein